MTWTQRLSEFLAPKQEPSQDLRSFEAAVRASERRIVLEEIAREQRMREYAKAWSGPKLFGQQSPARWFREQKVG